MGWDFVCEGVNFYYADDDYIYVYKDVNPRNAKAPHAARKSAPTKLAAGLQTETMKLFLNNPGLLLTHNQIWYGKIELVSTEYNEELTEGNKQTLQNCISMIRNALRKLSRKPNLDPIFTQRGVGYQWTPVTKKADVSTVEVEAAIKKTCWEQEAHIYIAELIRSLKDEILQDENFFYRLGDSDTILPFFHMPATKFGEPNFPLPIDHTHDYPVINRGDGSIQRLRREILKLPVYPGQIYSLLDISPVDDSSHKKGFQWRLARTTYTDIIEACDYYALNIKAGWCEAYKRRQGIKFLRNSPDVKKWKELVGQIQQGNFTGYQAGIAFSLPIFEVKDDGSIALLAAISSHRKQAGAGLRHIIPAGMLEFSEYGDMKNTELTLEAFNTYVAKELIEETLLCNPKLIESGAHTFHMVASEDSPIQSGARSKGDSRPVNGLGFDIKNLLDNWDEYWEGEKPSKTPLQSVMEMQPCSEKSPFFLVVDAFTLRPEFIIPLYVRESLDLVLNWEYGGKPEDRHTFLNIKDLERWIKDQFRDWAPPGIAAAYFGAKYYFENKDSLQKII